MHDDDSQANEVGGFIENEVSDNIVTSGNTVLNSRPKRDRKQNVRYSSEEYDLSAVTVNPGTAKLKLSSIYVQLKSKKLTKKLIDRRV